MPIRINLKELFPADGQEITIDKINFNFNKLLELGIGDRGPKGTTGGQGSPGPAGNAGPQGQRGATWFTDSVTDPNTISSFPEELIDGDLYLDSTGFSIWQYDLISETWQFVANIGNIVNNYLAASPSPFVRGFGIGSPSDDRFIMFNNRGDDVADALSSEASTNDILFLNNFDEDTISGFSYGPYLNATGLETDTSEYYNSLLAIGVDHRVVATGRYHIELGSLFEDDGDVKLTTVKDNLKIRFSHEENPSLVHPVSSQFINKALFSLDIPELGFAGRALNAYFQFQSPKVASGVDATSSVYLSSSYGLDEIVGAELVKADGILFSSSQTEGSAYANIGISARYLIPSFPSDTGYVYNDSNNSYLMLDTPVNLTAVYIDDSLYQDGGNIIQVGTTEPRQKTSVVSRWGSPGSAQYLNGIISVGNEVYSVHGNSNIFNDDVTDLTTKFGYINKFVIENPNSPTSEWTKNATPYYSKFAGGGSNTGGTGCSSIYTPATLPIGPGLSDLKSDGNYFYVVNAQSFDLTLGSKPIGSIYNNTQFQILKKEGKYDIGLSKVSFLGEEEALDAAYRVELYSKFALVGGNALHGKKWAGITDLNISDATQPGAISVINISDPEDPKLVLNQAYPSGMFTSGTVDPDCAVLDTTISGNRLFVLGWYQKPVGKFDTTTELKVRVDAYSLDSLNENEPSFSTANWIGNSATSFVNDAAAAFVTLNSYDHVGAITANNKYIYAGHGSSILIYQILPTLNVSTAKGTGCYLSMPQVGSTSVSGTIYDIHQAGNSLYVSTFDGTSLTRVYKFDVSDPANTTEIWVKELTATYGEKFVVVGKHIYLSTKNYGSTSDSNVPSLIAIDFDGFYTGGAHIESLRADELTVTKDANVGGSLIVAESVNIGASLTAQGGISANRFDGNVFYGEHTTQIAINPNHNILSSGYFNYASGGTTIQGNWTKAGRTVTFTGKFVNASTSTAIMNVPIVTALGGVKSGSVFGHGIIENWTAVNTRQAAGVFAQYQGPNSIDWNWPNGVGGSDYIIPASGNVTIHFTVTYQLED